MDTAQELTIIRMILPLVLRAARVNVTLDQSAGGSARIRPNALDGGLWSIWFNPRTNVWLPAYPDEQGRFVAPDKEDWALQFSVGPTGQRASVTDDTTMRGLTICRMHDGSIMGG